MSNEPIPQTEAPATKKEGGSKAVAIVAIIATTIVILACIIACSTIAGTFLLNAPW